MSSLVDGLRYPFRGDRTIDLFAIGGSLGIAAALLVRLTAATAATALVYVAAPLALVPMVALLGYLSRAFAATLDGADEPPSFGSARGLLARGYRALAVSILYLGLPGSVVAIAVGALVAGGVSPTTAGPVGSILFFGLSTLLLLAAFAVGYVYPAAFGAVARGGGVREALAVPRHLAAVWNGEYFYGWALAVACVVVGWAAIAAAVTGTSLFGLIAVFVAFYAHLIAVRLVASGL